jgi:hypothetical protein
MRNTVESPTCGGTDSRRPSPRVAIVTCERLPRFALEMLERMRGRVQREDVPSFEGQFLQALSQSDVLVQQFQPEIVSEGEWSVCFFGGEFSHAVLKRPREGDFRTQPELGGSRRQMIPPPVVLAGSAAVLAQAEASTLYARVDGIVSDGAFRLMELELIEPSLYFDGDGAAAGRFADAALRLVR